METIYHNELIRRSFKVDSLNLQRKSITYVYSWGDKALYFSIDDGKFTLNSVGSNEPRELKFSINYLENDDILFSVLDHYISEFNCEIMFGKKL